MSVESSSGAWVDNEPAASDPEESWSNLAPMTIAFSMRCDPSALSHTKQAIYTALRNVVAEFGGREFRLERMRVGPSNDTLQRVLPFLVDHVDPESAVQFFRVCKPWQRELEARGFCKKTVQLFLTLALGGKRRGQNALQRLNTSTFLQRSSLWEEWSLHKWLQAASQEPDSSCLARGATSTAKILGLPLVEWVGKPAGGCPGVCTLRGHTCKVMSVAFSADGKRIVSGSWDKLVKIWDAATRAEVSSVLAGVSRMLCVRSRLRLRYVGSSAP